MERWISDENILIFQWIAGGDVMAVLGALLCLFVMGVSAWGVVHSLHNIMVIICRRCSAQNFRPDMEGLPGGNV